ncbi:type II secretion system protein [Candidatus Saccharibacteria bacterium]|nr:type II secretion system protein [Candidatus Saccharibacteria bacterium]
MKKGGLDNKTGFTIIEVVLVLAIAGLIFIMVFVALPALQRSQRDTSRREDILNFVSEVKKYMISNRGPLPGSGDTIDNNTIVNVTWNDTLAGSTGGNNKWSGFYRDYLGEKFVDPDGENYSLSVMRCGMGTDEQCSETTQPRVSAALEGLYEAAFPNEYKIYVILQAKCDGNNPVGSSNSRNIAVLYRLEGAGVYCANT